MTTRTVRTLVLAIVAPVVLGATVILVARQTSSATTVPVCIKSNGQVRVLIGANASCDSSEQRADWVVGGELTDITLGQGLTGSREGGTLQLAVAPSLLQRGRVFSGYNDGPGQITADMTTIAELNVPAGSYSIFAKLTADNDLSGVGPTRIECRLSAGVDFDAAGVVVEEAVFPFVGYLDTLNLNLVHHFSVAGTVTLACHTFGFVQNARYSHLKIIAIDASSISNVFLGSQ
jgi:hypothetical protein